MNDVPARLASLRAAILTMFVSAGLGVMVVACGTSGAVAGSAIDTSSTNMGATNMGATPEPAIAAEWRSKCASCHTRVEPGTRTRAELRDALGRHRTRARLSDEQWAALVDFLSPSQASAGATAANAK